MPPGKMAAQVAHASLSAFLSGGITSSTHIHIPVDEWVNGAHTKIVLDGVDEATIRGVEKALHDLGLTRTALIIDNGLTVFNGVKTMTALGVGPYEPALVKSILGKFKMV